MIDELDSAFWMRKDAHYTLNNIYARHFDLVEDGHNEHPLIKPNHMNQEVHTHFSYRAVKRDSSTPSLLKSDWLKIMKKSPLYAVQRKVFRSMKLVRHCDQRGFDTYN